MCNRWNYTSRKLPIVDLFQSAPPRHVNTRETLSCSTTYRDWPRSSVWMVRSRFYRFATRSTNRSLTFYAQRSDRKGQDRFRSESTYDTYMYEDRGVNEQLVWRELTTPVFINYGHYDNYGTTRHYGTRQPWPFPPEARSLLLPLVLFHFFFSLIAQRK